jgi:NAD(P)-dependent dehydrogenase (short-subunit alcohol dehydrogenase family)
VRDAIAQVLAVYGRLDYAHNNAGINGVLGTTADYAEDEWDRVVETDLKGVWLCMKYQIPALLSSGGGAIVNTGSAFGVIASPQMPAYTAAKHGLIGLTKSAALCYAKQNIRINSVNPGSVRTPMFTEVWGDDLPQAEALMARLHPIGRISEPEEIAQAVLWLCSTQSAFVVGHNLLIDGGLCAGLVPSSA